MVHIEVPTSHCPWPGLASYGMADAAWFFGRERPLRNLLRLLDSTGRAGVIGSSGSGKSSLLSAGLAAAGFRVVATRPGIDPLEALARVDEATRAEAGDGERRLIVVDQLEEIFTVVDDEDVRAEFLDRLCDLMDAELPVAFALRSDHYGSCAAYPRLAEIVAHSHILLGAPTEPELRSMVTMPAERAGLVVPNDLLNEIVDEVMGEPGALPLVSHVLSETFRNSSGGELLWKAYRDAGGVRGAIATTAEAAWLSLPPGQQRAARAMLVQLSEPDVAPFDTSRRVPVGALVPVGDAERRSTLDALAAARIVTIDGSNVEIAHEAVFREWPRLREWLLSDRESVRALNALRQSAQAWIEAGRDTSALLRGSRLTTAGQLVGSESAPVDDVVRDFVDHSRSAADDELHASRVREQATSRTNRRLRLLIVAVVVLGAVVGAIGVVASRRADDARAERDIADARRLAAASGILRADNGDLAALVAAEAFDLHADPQTIGAMLSAANARPGLQSYLHDDYAFTSVALRPGGDVLAVDDTEHAIGLWDISGEQPQRLAELPVDGDATVGSVRFIDASTIAVSDDSGRVYAFDVDTRRETWRAQMPVPITAMAGVGDGSLLAIGDEVGGVSVLDSATGGVVMTATIDDESAVNDLAFRSDGSTLTAVTAGGSLVTWTTDGWTAESPTTTFAAELWSVAFSPAADLLAVGTDSDLLFLDGTSGDVVGGPINAHNGIVHDVFFVDDETLVSGGEDGRVLFWDTERHELARPAIEAHSAGVLAFAIDLGTGRMATAGEDLRLGLWSLDLATAAGDPLLDGAPEVAGIARSDDGLVALAGRDGVLRFARLDGGDAPDDITVSDAALSSVSIASTGDVVAVATIDGSVQAFETASGDALTAPLAVGNRVASVAIDPTGRWLAAAQTDDTCTACTALFHLGAAASTTAPATSGPVPVRLRSAGLDADATARRGYAVAFDPAGGRLLTGDNSGYVDLWQLPDTEGDTPTNLWWFKLERGIRALAFSNDGSMAAVGANGGALLVVAADTGAEMQRLFGTRGRVGGLAFSPDDSLLATTGPDERTFRLWELKSGLPYSTPIVIGTDWVAVPAWSPTGDDIVVATRWGGPVAYHVDPMRLRAALCTLAQRNLTQREWHQYVGAARTEAATCNEFADDS